MKVLHFILGKANKNRANGVNQVIAGLAKYSARLGAELRVIGKAETVTHEGEAIAQDGFVVNAYSRWGAELRAALADGICWADIVHLHGVYSPWNLMVSRMCDTLNRPYIVTLHDGLSPERLRIRGTFRKRVFHELFQRRHLDRAACLHALTEEEATDVLSAVRPKSICCIPNGVDLDDYSAISLRENVTPHLANIGYLGRLSPEKNLEALCAAFARVNVPGNLRLKLAGPITEYGLALRTRYPSANIELVGPVYGQEKDQFIRALDLFVIPSLAEGFSIAVAEAMALGTPLLVTRPAKMAHFFDQRAFFMCEATAYGLERGLRSALARRSEWQVMTGNARLLIEQRLNWHAITREMLATYTEILRK